MIDAVGVDATRNAEREDKRRYAEEIKEIAPKHGKGDWEPGNAPISALKWAVQAVCKAGTVSIVGVYPPSVRWFPIGEAMNKNLSFEWGTVRIAATCRSWSSSSAAARLIRGAS